MNIEEDAGKKPATHKTSGCAGKMKHQANMKATKKASFLMKRLGEKKYLYLHGCFTSNIMLCSEHRQL